MEDKIKYYIAGLIDGEGTITLSKIHKNNKFRSPVISCSSTSPELLEYLYRYYGGSISKQKTYKEHHKKSWSWKITNHKAIKFCEDFKNTLIEPSKRRRAKLISDYYLPLTKRNGKYKPEEELAKLNFERIFFHPSTSVN